MLSINNGFDKLTDPQLLVRSQAIYASMNGNPHFLTPLPSLTDLQTKITEYSTALNNCKDGDRVKILLKDEKRAALIDTLHALSRFVLFTAPTRVIAATSGFTLNKERTPQPPIGTPATPTFANGINSGEMNAATQPLTGAKAYLFLYTADPITTDSVWTPQLASGCKTVLKGLTVGQAYWVKVSAVGAGDQVTTSLAALTKVVQ